MAHSYFLNIQSKGEMMKKLLVFLCAMLLVFGVVEIVWSYPALDQTGNLILNGNFETGTISPWRDNDNPTISITGDDTIDGQYSAFIDTTSGHPGDIGNWVVGLWQYPGLDGGSELPPNTYTASAWFYPIEGQAYIGMAWHSGNPGYSLFSNPTTSLHQWCYLEVTTLTFGLAGPVLYGLSNLDKFYVDGVWLNQGDINLSPYAPQNGFEPNAPVPEPSTMLLLFTGLIGLAGFRRKQLKK